MKRYTLAYIIGCLFVSLGILAMDPLHVAGAGPIGGNIVTRVGQGLVNTAQIANGAVTTPKLADGAVTTAKLASQAVTSAQIASAAVNTAQLAAMSVGTSQIANGAVTTAQLASGSVTQTKIGNGEVQTAALADASITTPKLASTAVTWGKMLAFRSVQQVGTGAPQNVAHLLGVTPAWCQAIVEDTVLTTNYTVAEGAHTATNCIFTVTNTVKFRVIAIAP